LLSIELERAMISNDAPNDSALYVTEPVMFLFLVSLHANSRVVLLQSYMKFLLGLSQAERMEFCERIEDRM